MSETKSKFCSFTTPVLFLVFNRPSTTKQVFEAIRQVKPIHLYVAADGPRKNKEGEAKKIKQVREIATAVDWKCEVKTLFRKKNLGCKIAISSAIDWFFENVEEGIILEDDCLPNQSFFWFCQELLEHYKNDARVMHISGNNFQFGIQRGKASYYFSRYIHAWGWATWRRAWKSYDVNMKSLEEFKEGNQIKNILRTKQEQIYWMNIFQAVYDGKIETWDYQWSYVCLINNGLSIIPNENLVANIGFGMEATHLKDENNVLSNMEVKNIKNIKHPNFILLNEEADRLTYKKIFSSNRMKNKISRTMKRIMDKFYEMYNM